MIVSAAESSKIPSFVDKKKEKKHLQVLTEAVHQLRLVH